MKRPMWEFIDLRKGRGRRRRRRGREKDEVHSCYVNI